VKRLGYVEGGFLHNVILSPCAAPSDYKTPAFRKSPHSHSNPATPFRFVGLE
jgi:hypothetical protein